MKTYNLTKEDKEFIEEAEDLLKKTKSKMSGVAAVIKSKKGNKYAGINIDVEPRCSSVCAEYIAIGSMMVNGEKKIDSLVALWEPKKDKYKILQPCGNCRQFILNFGNPFIIISNVKKAKFKDLYPYIYL